MQKVLKFLFFFLSFFICLSALAGGNEKIRSFHKAKQEVLKIHLEEPYTFYCKALFFEDKRLILPEGVVIQKYKNRADKIEFEHIVAAENFGRFFHEWREGHASCVDLKGRAFKGRKCALKVSKIFRLMYFDMHNLVPVIGSINAMRSNFKFTQFEEQVQNSFGVCPMKIENKKVEPPVWTRGQIARTHLYFEAEYKIFHLSESQRKLFLSWHKMYPPTSFECERNRKIAKIQGNFNHFTKESCEIYNI